MITQDDDKKTRQGTTDKDKPYNVRDDIDFQHDDVEDKVEEIIKALSDYEADSDDGRLR